DQEGRLLGRDECRQVLIDRLIGHEKNVPHATNASRGGVAPARQLEGQRLAGIERSSGKGPEAGDEDGGSHSTCEKQRERLRRISGAPGCCIVAQLGVNGAMLENCPTKRPKRRPFRRQPLPATSVPPRPQPRCEEALL